MQQGICLEVMSNFVSVFVVLNDENGQQWKRKEFDLVDVAEVGEIVKQVSSPDYDFSEWVNTLSPYGCNIHDGLTIGQPLTPKQIAEQNQRFDEEVKNKISMVMGLLEPTIKQHQKTQYMAAALNGLLANSGYRKLKPDEVAELANGFVNALIESQQ